MPPVKAKSGAKHRPVDGVLGHTGRVNSRRAKFLVGRPKGVYYPDAVGNVPGYPKTLEEWERRREITSAVLARNRAAGMTRNTRRGVPDGWGHRKPELVAARLAATAMATKIITAMKEQDLLMTDDEMALQALQAALEIVTAKDLKTGVPVEGAQARNAAIKTILEFTKKKPATAIEGAVGRPEDWLASLASK